MIKTLRLVTAQGAMLAGAIVISASAFAQAPTDAQREAIRSACRSDYIAHCSSVPPGKISNEVVCFLRQSNTRPSFKCSKPAM